MKATVITSSNVAEVTSTHKAKQSGKPSVEQVSARLLAENPVYKRPVGRPRAVKTADELRAELAAKQAELREMELQIVIASHPEAANAYNVMQAAKRAAGRVQEKIDELANASPEDIETIKSDAREEAETIHKAIAELQAELTQAEMIASGKIVEAYNVQLTHKRAEAENLAKAFAEIAVKAGIKLA